jgi:RNA polymerase sigma-70 factor (ECF subfamily)
MGVRDDLLDQVPRLRRYARALINNQDLADDLVQDTLERALRNSQKFQSGSDLRAWLFAIMHNAYVSQGRRAEARVVHVSVDDDDISEGEFAIPGEQTQTLELRDLDFALQRLPLDGGRRSIGPNSPAWPRCLYLA